MTYESTAKFVLVASETYVFDYTYSNPNVDPDYSFNSFGIAEAIFLGDEPYWASLLGDENDEAYFYQMNFLDAATSVVLELFDASEGVTYIFAIGGSLTTLPTSQQELDLTLGELNPITPVQNVPSPGAINPGTLVTAHSITV